MTGLIVAGFGTLDDAERARTLDAIAHDLSVEFPTFKILGALTSNFILRRLRARGLEVYSIDEQCDRLRAESVDEIVILPTHLTSGEEFDAKIKPFGARGARVLTPLFTADASTDFDRRALRVVVDCFRPSSDEALVLVGHGSPHRHNPTYESLQRLDDDIHIGVLEPSDRPNYDDVLGRLRVRGAKKILLAPLLLTGGVHVNDDIAGDGDCSWRSRLTADGFDVRVCLDGLGSFPAFRRLYIDKLKIFL